MKYHLYQELTEYFRAEISNGLRRPGERLPSVRELCAARKISKSTVLSAYGQLEAEGLIEPRPRSGYFVAVKSIATPAARSQGDNRPDSAPLPVSTDQVIIDIMEKGAAFDLLPNLVRETGNIDLRRALTRAHRSQSNVQQNYYNPPRGSETLRWQIANRLHSGGSHVGCDDLLITGGCQSAILLALMATTKPGDVVAIESPGFYGAIQLLEALGLKIMELPCAPGGGVDCDAMAEAFKRWKVTALILSPNYSTPTGSSISDADKQRILALCQGHGIAIIEDDIYAELHFGLTRPRTLHSYDQSGNVLLCSSFSKCLSRDIRIGWIAPGKYMEKVERLKIVTALSTSGTVQEALVDYMQRGFFERNLRHKRLNLAQQCHQLQDLIAENLPSAISWTQPAGGLSLWLELPPAIDTIALYHRAQRKGITITPGALFTSQRKFTNFIRLSFNHVWSEARISALKDLGTMLV